jgi:very-short-patch-repair endonuclease
VAGVKTVRVRAERQERVKVKGNYYSLDFAIYCANGKIDIETDGDTWHTGKTQAAKDNLRDNHLETEGWRTLRFTARQVREEMETYCIPTIVKNINRLGGLTEDKQIARMIYLDGVNSIRQLPLF